MGKAATVARAAWIPNTAVYRNILAGMVTTVFSVCTTASRNSLQLRIEINSAVAVNPTRRKSTERIAV